MTKVITDTQDIAEALELYDEEGRPMESLAATEQPDPAAKLEFHVQMKDWTLRDMEALIVEAAARQIVGLRGESQLSKQIQDRVIELTTEKLDDKLSSVTYDILNQRVMTPSYGAQKAVTLAEYIGLTSQAYLSEKVGNDGKPTTSSYHSVTRAQYLVEQAMQVKFILSLPRSQELDFMLHNLVGAGDLINTDDFTLLRS